MERIKPYKEIFGFGDKGYITLLRGDQDLYEDYLKASPARYHNELKWYFPEEVPSDLPIGLEPVQLPINKFINPTTDQLLPQKDRLYNIESTLYGESSSDYFGEVNYRYDFVLKCVYVKTSQSYYGAQNYHVLQDKDGNIFTWSTTSRLLEKDKFYSCRGTVKAHTIYHNQKQTELTRVMSFKERSDFNDT